MPIASSAILVSLNISVWPATKLDRQVTDKVTTDANADYKAGKFMKDLFAGTNLRKDIEKYAAHCRVRHLKFTVPWADKGDRLLPTKLFMRYKDFINDAEPTFKDMKQRFIDAYPQLLADAPTRLGALYKSDDYPPVEDVMERFGFRYVFSPLPEAGDFRLDVANEDLEALKQEYASNFDARIETAMREPWERLHTMLKGMSEKLAESDDKKRWHDTFVSNPIELCGLLSSLNITNDPQLEEARRQLELTMVGADIEAIKESPAIRESMKSKVDEILGKFDW